MEKENFKTAKGLQAVLQMCEEAGLAVYGVGFGDTNELTIPSKTEIVSRLRKITGTENSYPEFKLKVKTVEKFSALGSLTRSYKINESDDFQKPNKEKNLSELLEAICGKTIKITKVAGAIAPNFSTQVYEPVTVYKYEIKK